MNLLKRAAVAVASAALVTGAAGIAAGPAFAASPPGPGQPSQSCGSDMAPNSPGHASTASGSAFNEDPGGAGDVYAGSPGTHSKLNANSTNAISQYDVACFQVSQPH